MRARSRGETGLARFCVAKAFYDDKPEALAPPKEELAKRLRKAFHPRGCFDERLYFSTRYSSISNAEP